MVVKIQKSHGAMNGTLAYNENKVRRGVASIVGFSGMDSADPKETARVFGILEKRNIRTEKISFQMTINPNPENPDEVYSDEEIFSLASDLMGKMKYGNQPFVVYKHQDIDRTHYHVVSCRVNEEGRKIDDKFEKKNIIKYTQQFKEKYHYELGENTKTKKKKESRPPKKAEPVESPKVSAEFNDYMPDLSLFEEPMPIGQPVPYAVPDEMPEKAKTETGPIMFDNSKDDVCSQYIQVTNEALNYHFSSFNQFKAICESMGVTLSTYVDSEGEHISVQGLDEYGEKARIPVTEDELGEQLFVAMSARIEECTGKEQAAAMKSSSKPDRARVGRMAAFCLEHSKNQEHLERMLRKKGIYVTFSYNVNKELFGATFVDRKSKSAFKASELIPAMHVNDILEKKQQWYDEERVREERKQLAAERHQIKRDTFLFSTESQTKVDEAQEMEALANGTWYEILHRPFKKIRRFKIR